jgi:hypothetical protein
MTQPPLKGLGRINNPPQINGWPQESIFDIMNRQKERSLEVSKQENIQIWDFCPICKEKTQHELTPSQFEIEGKGFSIKDGKKGRCLRCLKK